LETIRKLWLKMLHRIEIVIGESIASRAECDSLTAELSTYRPTKADRPAAPALDDYTWVTTGKAPWICAAKTLRQTIWISTLFGGGYHQEHYTNDRKTLCGAAALYPVNERFTSGGWPRLHELCPDCTRGLVDLGLLGQTAVGVDAPEAHL